MTLIVFFIAKKGWEVEEKYFKVEIKMKYKLILPFFSFFFSMQKIHEGTESIVQWDSCYSTLKTPLNLYVIFNPSVVVSLKPLYLYWRFNI